MSCGFNQTGKSPPTIMRRKAGLQGEALPPILAYRAPHWMGRALRDNAAPRPLPCTLGPLVSRSSADFRALLAVAEAAG